MPRCAGRHRLGAARISALAAVVATLALMAPASASAGSSGVSASQCATNGAIIEFGGGCAFIVISNTLRSTTLTLATAAINSGEWTSDQPPPSTIKPLYTDSVVAASTPFIDPAVEGFVAYAGADGLLVEFSYSPGGNDATVKCGTTPCIVGWNRSANDPPPPFVRLCGATPCSNRSVRVGVLYGEGSAAHPQLSLARRYTARSVLRSGLPFAVSTSLAGRLDATLILDRPARSGPPLIAGRLRRAVRAGRTAHVLRLNAVGRALVRGRRRSFVLSVGVRAADGRMRTDGARLTLR